MSEITPNTPNPVREDAYVEELATKLGIDPQYIPKTPVWRNEEEIKAIAEMFANMAGGSSGGGVLVVNVTADPETGFSVCDKTAGEIMAVADAGGSVVFKEADENGRYIDYIASATYNNGLGYIFNTGDGSYKAESANDYPESGSAPK
jgi:hypothetical protein